MSIRFILFGLMAPFAAALLNRYGLRNVTLTAQLVVVSHEATDAQLSATVERLRDLEIVREVTSVMRVEGDSE